MRWFGTVSWARLCAGEYQTETPVGESCAHCAEPIAADESGVIMPFSCGAEQPMHAECFLRNIFGSVAHQMRTCSCYGGAADDAPAPGQTVREEAALAVELARQKIELEEPPDSGAN